MLDLFTDDVRRPVTAIGVTVREAYIHCAKAFRRGGIWQPETWPEPAERPSPATAFISQSVSTGDRGIARVEPGAGYQARPRSRPAGVLNGGQTNAASRLGAVDTSSTETLRCRPIGTTIGVPATGSAMTRHAQAEHLAHELLGDHLGRVALATTAPRFIAMRWWL